ncbi:hypothetical protein SAMN02745244_01701 [Tessaracoccus bendigoensis DSM 12906]|uniref:Uncharacterized protein n=1 Tax=Tessaracoccus bendigoensis DSM 12906 TaxID=1123357 RepID=A0A1M6GFZ5_9ACTN|nr:hypothetical protein [Tessaracoccus bendigoensis]SHJ08803.1 hypothetical protein SAMN02745244_01701 [Tessaracoccus bendigoensis DSM 12906]
MTALPLATDQADVRCTHVLGRAPQQASQNWVQVMGHPLLVAPDPVGRSIGGCPNIGISIKPCTGTLAVRQGLSPLVRIDRVPVVRADLVGFTDGTPPGAVEYRISDAGQQLLWEKA